MEQNIENLKDEVMSFIRDYLSDYKIAITESTSIEDDLYLTGEEAEDLLIKYSKRYKVNLENFMFSNYFNDEPKMLPVPRVVKPLTISHLAKGIIAGKLDEEVINS